MNLKHILTGVTAATIVYSLGRVNGIQSAIRGVNKTLREEFGLNIDAVVQDGLIFGGVADTVISIVNEEEKDDAV